FLNLLFMLVVPLVFSSLTLGVTGLRDLRRLGRIGARTLLFFLLATALALVLGVVVADVVQPGNSIDPGTRAALLRTYADQAAQQRAAVAKPFDIDMVIALVPRNPIYAAARGDMLGVMGFTVLCDVAPHRTPLDAPAPLLRGLDAR